MSSLVLFFSRGMSVKKWLDSGLFDREKLIYEALLEAGDIDEVKWYCYGLDDETIVDRLHHDGQLDRRITVLQPSPGQGRAARYIHEFIGPFLHRAALRKADIFKTNQVSGSWTALIAKLMFRKPLVFRCGYALSLRYIANGKPWHSRLARIIERIIVRASDAVLVTSKEVQNLFSQFSGTGADREVVLIPNYIGMSRFTAISNFDQKTPLLYIGRLEPQKNIANLIRACAALDQPLDIYGKGSLEGELKALAVELGATVAFKGLVPNREIPGVHQAHSCFILCSKWEGMPKALIEAMASGMICICSRIKGIDELIVEGQTGYFFDDFEEKTITDKLHTVLAQLDPAVGARAREFVEQNYSVAHARSVEADIIRPILIDRS